MSRRWKDEKGELVKAVDWVDAGSLEGDSAYERLPSWPRSGDRAAPGADREVVFRTRGARGRPVAHGGGPGRAPASSRAPEGASQERVWFAVRVVDELGEPVAGLPITLEAGGPRPLVTAADGTARVDGVVASAGRLVVDDVAGAKALLRARSRTGTGRPPTGPDVTTRALVGARLSIAIEPEREATLVLTPQLETVWIRLDIDPDDPDNQDDRFTLTSKDGSYAQTLHVSDDKVEGDDCVDLEFTGVDPEGAYSLQIDPGDSAPYYVFRDVPFAELDADDDAASGP